jgi:diguanylate cyclase (GGDEF)-like protein
VGGLIVFGRLQAIIAQWRAHKMQNSPRSGRALVAPIMLIVGVAMTLVIVVIAWSAQRIDMITVDHERQLLKNAITEKNVRMLREVASMATSEGAMRNVWQKFNFDWVHSLIGVKLTQIFGHDYVFIANPDGKLIYAIAGETNIEPERFGTETRTLTRIVNEMQKYSQRSGAAETPPAQNRSDEISASQRESVQTLTFLGRPAIVAAMLIAPTDTRVALPDGTPPVLVAIDIIDEFLLAEIGNRFDLANFRRLDAPMPPEGDEVFELLGTDGAVVSRLAWTPRRPSVALMTYALPFVLIVCVGFGIFAVFILRYMRATAATIEAGETRMRHLALHDPLSGLPNRMYFTERLEAIIEEVRDGRPPAAILYLDLDHFKDVNDTLGHSIGDELIRSVTQRLLGSAHPGDLVARIGGDEFAMITQQGIHHATLLTTAARIISAICSPYSINDHTIVIGASVGIAIIDERAGSVADVMRYADMALYRAKNDGRGRACIYDNVMDADLLNRKELERDLRAAIENDALDVAYQPVVNASGETTIGVEALARWTHPVRGQIPPVEFIPIAEHSGLIVQLGEWVLRRACLDAKSWPDLTLAVNVSPLQFRRADFVDTVERILTETGFDPRRLELEVTESTLIGNAEHAESAMRRLKALDVRLALDDFGTGYSSLSYLRRYPFDKLKIDHSFVRSIEKAADAAAIVHAVVSLGRGLGMKVTAEGVETAEQHLFLRAAGVHYMQGYRFGRPMPAADITARLAASASKAMAG